MYNTNTGTLAISRTSCRKEPENEKTEVKCQYCDTVFNPFVSIRCPSCGAETEFQCDEFDDEYCTRKAPLWQRVGRWTMGRFFCVPAEVFETVFCRKDVTMKRKVLAIITIAAAVYLTIFPFRSG